MTTIMNCDIPDFQQAVQLVGPDELVLNAEKPVFSPGPKQILCRIEAVGLCFSDLKLLKQFAAHPRKGEIVSGMDPQTLDEIPSYVPGELPTVPGHEACVRVCDVGRDVVDVKPGERYLVQTDYRWLPTNGSNASFGYDFEGGLQEYVLMDERIITSPEGESMLIPALEEVSASAVALVEPWACVENSYASPERTTIHHGGRMLVVADSQISSHTFGAFLKGYGKPGEITWVSEHPVPHGIDIPVKQAASIGELADLSFDDIIYLGSKADTIEALFPKIAAHGLLNITLCDSPIERTVTTAIGRVHYGGIRIIGNTGCDPSTSMQFIPETGEIRKGDKINVVGAAGPMGMMHVIRNICQGIPKASVYAGDLNETRLAVLNRIAEPLAAKNHVHYKPYDPRDEAMLDERFTYIALMVPVPVLVAQAVKSGMDRAIINVFAGIPAQVTADIDLNAYIEHEQYFIGTSGSVLRDMRIVLAKVQETHQLDTNLSVAAITGLDGAVEGIRAVEKQLMSGKIIVYPECKGLGLTTLEQLTQRMPEVAACLDNGLWNKRAEEKLLELYGEK